MSGYTVTTRVAECLEVFFAVAAELQLAVTGDGQFGQDMGLPLVETVGSSPTIRQRLQKVEDFRSAVDTSAGLGALEAARLVLGLDSVDQAAAAAAAPAAPAPAPAAAAAAAAASALGVSRIATTMRHENNDDDGTVQGREWYTPFEVELPTATLTATVAPTAAATATATATAFAAVTSGRAARPLLSVQTQNLSFFPLIDSALPTSQRARAARPWLTVQTQNLPYIPLVDSARPTDDDHHEQPSPSPSAFPSPTFSPMLISEPSSPASTVATSVQDEEEEDDNGAFARGVFDLDLSSSEEEEDDNGAFARGVFDLDLSSSDAGRPTLKRAREEEDEEDNNDDDDTTTTNNNNNNDDNDDNDEPAAKRARSTANHVPSSSARRQHNLRLPCLPRKRSASFVAISRAGHRLRRLLEDQLTATVYDPPRFAVISEAEREWKMALEARLDDSEFAAPRR